MYLPLFKTIDPIFAASPNIASLMDASVPRVVLLDSNALLMPFQFPIHLDAELRRLLGDVEVVVPEPVLAELEFLIHSFPTRRSSDLKSVV